MQMLYNSDHYAVVQIEVAVDAKGSATGVEAPEGLMALTRGGYEIVDKLARKEIFIEGAYAEQFKLGVEALIQTSPSEDEIDAYVSRYATLAHQPIVLH